MVEFLGLWSRSLGFEGVLTDFLSKTVTIDSKTLNQSLALAREGVSSGLPSNARALNLGGLVAPSLDRFYKAPNKAFHRGYFCRGPYTKRARV